MSKNSSRPKKNAFKAVPIYAFALTWISCSIFLPLYNISGLATTFLASFVVSFVVSKLITKLTKEKPAPEHHYQEDATYYTQATKTVQSQKSNPPEVNEIIKDGKLAMREMGRLYGSISSPAVKTKINELLRISDKIVQDAEADPSDVPQIRKFLDYYLPTTIKLLNAYDRMSDQGITGSNLTKSMTSIEEMLDTAIVAYEKQLDSLFANQALDIETDISVMNSMLAREGLASNSLDDFLKKSRTDEGAV